MCGLEGLMLALKLAGELVQPQYDSNTSSNFTIGICGCGCAVTESARLRCEADKLEAQSRRVAEHNAKEKEFRSMLRMCGIK